MQDKSQNCQNDQQAKPGFGCDHEGTRAQENEEDREQEFEANFGGVGFGLLS